MSAFDVLFEKTAAADDIVLQLLHSGQYQNAENFEKEVSEFNRENRPKFYATVAGGTLLGAGGAAGVAKALKKKPLKPALITLPFAAASSAVAALNALGKKYTEFEEQSKLKYGLE